MKIANSLFLLFLSYFTFSQKTVNEMELTKSESKLYLQQELYSGMVVNRFPNNQVKSIYQVNQGFVKGRLIEYWYDSEFKTLNYQDTAELTKLNFQLVTNSNQLEGKIQDSIQANKLTLDYLNDEIGGNEKWIALEIKNKNGKLKSKKKELFDKYEQLVKGKNSANLILSETRKAIRELNQKINQENQKPSFKGKKSKELEQENFIAEGNAIIYDSLGNKFGEGNFIKGLQNGTWLYYFNNGSKMAEVNFLNGDGGNKGATGIPKNGRDGLFNSFYKNGNPEAINPYKSGKLNGLCTFYYENGKKRTVSNYKAGELDGLYNTYYENGNKNQVSNFKDGKLDGLANLFYENGNKADISNYKAGQLSGIVTLFYETGNKKDVSNYKAGILDGIYTAYYDNGNKKEQSIYLNGKLEGLYTSYYENGNKKHTRNQKDGGIYGKIYFYHDNGKLATEGTAIGDGSASYKIDSEYNFDGQKIISQWFNSEDEFNGSKKIFSNSISGGVVGSCLTFYKKNRWQLMEGGMKYTYFTQRDMFKYTNKSVLWYIKINGVNNEYYSYYEGSAQSFINEEILAALMIGTEVTIKIGGHEYIKFSLTGFERALSNL